MSIVLKCILIVLIGAGGLFSSCSVFPEVVLYNHSGKDLTLRSDSQSYYIANGAIISVRDPGLTRIMKLSYEGGEWEYKFAYPPREFFKPKFPAGEEIHFQVEPGGLVYVLKPDISMPVQELPLQPPGFPLTPKGL